MANNYNHHIRLNSKNRRHREQAEYMDNVPHKYKTAFFVAAIEAYRRVHPHGVDYKELEEIRRETWTGFRPTMMIRENLLAKQTEPLQDLHPVPNRQRPLQPLPDEPPSTNLADSVLDYYSIGDDDD